MIGLIRRERICHQAYNINRSNNLKGLNFEIKFTERALALINAKGFLSPCVKITLDFIDLCGCAGRSSSLPLLRVEALENADLEKDRAFSIISENVLPVYVNAELLRFLNLRENKLIVDVIGHSKFKALELEGLDVDLF